MASTETIIFDAASSNIDGTSPGSPLTVGWGTNYRLFEHEYPAPPQNVLYASSIDTEGEIPASSRFGNRTITLKFKLVDANGSLRTALQAKFAKLQREGGTLKRTMADGAVRIYDILAGDGWNPTYDFAYYIGNLTVVEMSLPARPFSRGAEVDLGDNVETTLPVLVFTEATVDGDVPALGRLLIDEDQTQDQRTVLWGIQSRYYSASAPLFFQAESGSVVSAVVATGPAGSSGGASNNTMFNSTVPLFPAYDSDFALSGTHIGTFRVVARIQLPNTNAGTVSARLRWTANTSNIIENDWVEIETISEGNWMLLDLGQVTSRVMPVGTTSLALIFDSTSTVANDDIYWDWVALFPVEEGWGQVDASALSLGLPLPSGGQLQISHSHVFAKSGSSWARPNSFHGNYLLIPPSGAEARTLQVIVKASRGRLHPCDFAVGAASYDVGTDDISARLFVTPRYLT